MAAKIECPKTSNPNPVKAIRLKCLDCSGGSREEVKLCVIPECPLYPFRLGRNPFRTVVKRELTDEQRAELKDRMERLRLKRQAAAQDGQQPQS